MVKTIRMVGSLAGCLGSQPDRQVGQPGQLDRGRWVGGQSIAAIRLEREGPRNRLRRHVPGVEDLGLQRQGTVNARARQINGPFFWLLLAEVDEVILALLPGGAIVLPLVDWLDPVPGAVLQDVSEKSDPFRAFSAQRSTLRPPDEIVRVAVRLPMTDVGPRDGPVPEAVDHLLGREVPPPLLEVTLVLHFV